MPRTLRYHNRCKYVKSNAQEFLQCERRIRIDESQLRLVQLLSAGAWYPRTKLMSSSEHLSYQNPSQSQLYHISQSLDVSLRFALGSTLSGLEQNECITLVDEYSNQVAKLIPYEILPTYPVADECFVSGRLLDVRDSEIDRINRSPWLSYQQTRAEIAKRGQLAVRIYQTRLPPSNHLLSLLTDASKSKDTTVVLQLILDSAHRRFLPDALLLRTFSRAISRLEQAGVILTILALPDLDDRACASASMLAAKNLGASIVTFFTDEYPRNLTALLPSLSEILKTRIESLTHSPGFVSSLKQMKGSGSYENIVQYTDGSTLETLRCILPPLKQRGLVVMFVGLSGSGKTTLATALRHKMSERTITHLDGDEMRSAFSQDLGYDINSRIIHVRRMMFIAAEIAKHGGTVLVSTVAPVIAIRQEFRSAIENDALSKFLLVYMNTSYEDCSQRDPKGLYRMSKSRNLPGISTAFEEPGPSEPHVRIDGSESGLSVSESVELVRKEIVDFLSRGRKHPSSKNSDEEL